MKANKGHNGNRRQNSITEPLLKDLLTSDQANPKLKLEDPTVSSFPLNPPDLYQDSGQGFNPDFTFIQE